MTQPDPTVNSPVEPDPVEPVPSADTTMYVRRRRTPTLAFWVVLALIVPAVVALLAAPFLRVDTPRDYVNLAMVAILAIGAPLAAIACVVDMILERRRGRSGR